MSVILRAAAAADMPAVGRVHQLARAGAYAHLLSPESLAQTTPETMADYWSERLTWERDICQLTVASLNGKIVGFTYVGPSETPGAVELCAIHVLPETQGTGVGRTLMLDALTRLAHIIPIPTDEDPDGSAAGGSSAGSSAASSSSAGYGAACGSSAGSSAAGGSAAGSGAAGSGGAGGENGMWAVLWVLAGNDHARRFYEKGGWSPDGTTGAAPINDELVPQLRYSRHLTP